MISNYFFIPTFEELQLYGTTHCEESKYKSVAQIIQLVGESPTLQVKHVASQLLQILFTSITFYIKKI